MKIQSLTLRGFKSFADETKIELHEGITAVVGPNGCGKSNISDALRWVLGEQRPTAIRGSRMEEAIFGGTAQRRPIHRAEVSLELNNEDRTLPVPYSEVAIGRTVYRGGEGEYRLNGSPCRLRDIQDLCRDTGLGANAYAIIEHRMVDAILSDRAEERRGLFEEAAEVGRYKDRRRTALRRLEQAESDLQRLDDVLSEVQSKVRSLARQRGRAQRHLELRERRLRLEVAVAGARLSRAREEAAAAEAELAELEARKPSEEAGLRTAETEAERLRVEIAERERERGDAARRLEAVRARVEERERERLVAEERVAAADRRIAAIEAELERLALRREGLELEIGTAREAVEQEEARASTLAGEEAALRAEVEELAAAREAAVTRLEEARGRAAEIERRMGRLTAERRTADERVEERSEELERRRSTLSELAAAVEAAVERARALEAGVGEAGRRAESAETELEALRGELEEGRRRTRELRDAVGRLEGDLSGARARAASLAALVDSDAHLPEVVAELLEAGAGVPGVEGVLADSLSVAAEHARAVEAHLGPYLHAVVVRDFEAVGAARAWLAARSEEEGLLLLPLEPGPRAAVEPRATSGRSLLDVVEVEGSGAPWARALLAGVAFHAERDLVPEEGPWARADGSGQDPWGAVRLGQPGSGRGVLSRRVELEGLRERIEELEAELASRRRELEEAELRVESVAGRTEGMEAAARRALRERDEAEARRTAEAERVERLRAEASEVEARIADLERAVEEARSGAEAGDDRLEGLRREAAEAEAAAARARAEAEAASEAYESRRGALHDLQLRSARTEADLAGTRDRLRRAEAALREVEERRQRLSAEADEQRDAARTGRATLGAGEEEVVDMLEARSGLEGELRAAEARLGEVREALEAREAEAREARKTERAHADRRHALELRIAELRNREASVHERLEAEWDASFDALEARVVPPEEGTPDAWEEELDEVRRKLARIGPVNLLAEEEYGEEKERLDFLSSQRDDLLEARDDLRDSIRRINRKAAESFTGTFEQIRENFQRTFTSLFEGGQCDLWLEDPDDPLDSPIEISASPRGKRTQRIHLLSGGERALTALALLFAIYLAKPSPFCLLDEVDAPLDENNVLRFVGMLERFKADTQFIIITHNPRTIEAADWIYGVTMQEPGVSSVVGVRFEEEVAGRVA